MTLPDVLTSKRVRVFVLKLVPLILCLLYPVLWSTCSQVKILVPLGE